MTTPESTPRIREKILAIYNLMVGAKTLGEASAAQNRLEVLLKKYDINIDDLINPEPPKEWVDFKWTTKTNYQLLLQVFYKVLEKPLKAGSTYKYMGHKRFQAFITKEQAIDIGLLYNVYVKAWRKTWKEWKAQEKVLYDAFIQANQIFPDTDDDYKAEELTPERLEYLQRLMNLKKDIKPTPDPRSKGYLESKNK